MSVCKRSILGVHMIFVIAFVLTFVSSSSSFPVICEFRTNPYLPSCYTNFVIQYNTNLLNFAVVKVCLVFLILRSIKKLSSTKTITEERITSLNDIILASIKSWDRNVIVFNLWAWNKNSDGIEMFRFSFVWCAAYVLSWTFSLIHSYRRFSMRKSLCDN